MPEPTGDFITVKNYNYDLDVYRYEVTQFDKHGTPIPDVLPHLGKGMTAKVARIGGRLYVAENRPYEGPARGNDLQWDEYTRKPVDDGYRPTWKERTARNGGVDYFRTPVESSPILDTFVLLAVMAENDSTYRPQQTAYKHIGFQGIGIVNSSYERVLVKEAVPGVPTVTYRPQALDRALGFPVTPQVTALREAGLLRYRPDIRDKRERVQSVELTVEDSLMQAVRDTCVGGEVKGVWYPQDPITDPDGEALAEAFSEALGS